MFIDKARIFIKSGDGGSGAVSFRREKYVPKGGPDGGDGGRGGDVIFEVDTSLHTLSDFRYKRHYVARNGEHGKGANKSGKDGESLVIKVPLGTLIYHAETGELLGDLVEPGQRQCLAAGGRGGRGNARFATSVRRTPRFSENGTNGDEKWVELELKLLADVGLVGFPNAGKSTFISRISNARPKVADYPFTTLVPNLGVVGTSSEDSFVVADLPGLIEGASKGVGLGHEFLRHVERTRVLAYVIDVSGTEPKVPADALSALREEVRLYYEELVKRPSIVIANKIDIPTWQDHIDSLRQVAASYGWETFPISAVTGEGVSRVTLILQALVKSSHHEVSLRERSVVDLRIHDEDEPKFTVRREDDIFIVEGDAVERLMSGIRGSDYETLRYLHKRLESLGILDALVEAGVKDGDTVRIENVEFDYVL